MWRKICVNLLHCPVRTHDAVGVEAVLLPVEHELITVLKSLCFVQERRVAERAVLWEPARADGQDPRRVGRAERRRRQQQQRRGRLTAPPLFTANAV